MDSQSLSQIMSQPAYTIHANERLDKALFLFQSHQISILPVVNTNGCCVGVITLKDLVDKQNELITECRSRGWIADRNMESESSEVPISFFGDISVFDGMSEDFYSISEDATIEQCIELFLTHHIHHVPVLNDEQRLVGVVSTLDLIKYMGDEMTKSNDEKMESSS